MARGRDALRKGVITNQQHNSNNGLATQPNSQCQRPKGDVEQRMTRLTSELQAYREGWEKRSSQNMCSASKVRKRYEMTSGTQVYRRTKDWAPPVSKKNASCSTEADSPAFVGVRVGGCLWQPPYRTGPTPDSINCVRESGGPTDNEHPWKG